MKYFSLNLYSTIASLFSKTPEHQYLSGNENDALEYSSIGPGNHLDEDSYMTLHHVRRATREPLYDIYPGNKFINVEWNLDCEVMEYINITRGSRRRRREVRNLNITCEVVGSVPLEYIYLITQSGDEKMEKGDETLVYYRDSGMEFTGNYLEIHSTQRKVVKFLDNDQLRLSQVTYTYGQTGPRQWTNGKDLIFDRVPDPCLNPTSGVPDLPFCSANPGACSCQRTSDEEVCMATGSMLGRCVRARGVECETGECAPFGAGWKCTHWTARDVFRRAQKYCCKTTRNACN